MLIAQISDMHVLAEGWVAFGAVDTNRALERAIAWLNALKPRPDAVLITGDMVNDGDADQYHALVHRLTRLELPYFPVLGNHDEREAARAAFAQLFFMPETGPIRYTAEIGGLALVALDSNVPGKPYGRLGDEQLAWLDETLALRAGRPTIVMLHHPPFETGVAFMDWSALKDGAALAAVIGRHPHVERVLCGHMHRPIQRRFAGTIAMTAPGTAHQVPLDLTGKAEEASWIEEPPAILLHRLGDDGALVSHLAYLGDYGLAVPFSDDHARAEA